MLNKLLRAPLPEQIIALLEKLEQNPDTSHLEKVENLLGYHATKLTLYEEWVIRREMRKVYRAVRREETLNNVMRIVINEKTEEEKLLEEYNRQSISYTKQLAMSMQATKNAVTSGTLAHHAQLHRDQEKLIKAHQAAQQAQYAQGWTDPRGYMGAGNQ